MALPAAGAAASVLLPIVVDFLVDKAKAAIEMSLIGPLKEFWEWTKKIVGGIIKDLNPLRMAGNFIKAFAQGLYTAAKYLFQVENHLNNMARVTGEISNLIRDWGGFFTLASAGIDGFNRGMGEALSIALQIKAVYLSFLETAFGETLGPIVSGVANLSPQVNKLVAQFAIAGGVMAGFGAALFEIGKAGIGMNQQLESSRITVGTLIAEYKDLYEVIDEGDPNKQGDEQLRKIGEIYDETGKARERLTEAQVDALSVEERGVYFSQLARAEQVKLKESMEQAAKAQFILTKAAAESPYTTGQLLGAFQATFSVLGVYNVESATAAKLTAQFARVASVAGVSTANLASQLTLWLRGIGRITSPLARFMSGIGLGREQMIQFNKELEKNKDNQEATDKIIKKIEIRLISFSLAGLAMAESFSGIMSNMTEQFELFAAVVTEGMFEKIKAAFLNFENDANGAAVKVTGALSKIFNYKIEKIDGVDQFVLAGEDLTEIFNEKLQPAIQKFQQFFEIVGNDIVLIIDYVAESFISWMDAIGKNDAALYDFYYTVQICAEFIWELIGILFQWTDATKENQNVITFASLTILSFVDTLLACAEAVMELRYWWNLLTLDFEGMGEAKRAKGTIEDIRYRAEEVRKGIAAGTNGKRELLELDSKGRPTGNVIVEYGAGEDKRTSKRQMDEAQARANGMTEAEMRAAGIIKNRKIEKPKKRGGGGDGKGGKGGKGKKPEFAELDDQVLQDFVKLGELEFERQVTLLKAALDLTKEYAAKTAELLKLQQDGMDRSPLQTMRETAALQVTTLDAQLETAREVYNAERVIHVERMNAIKAEYALAEDQYAKDLARADSAIDRENAYTKFKAKERELNIKLAEEEAKLLQKGIEFEVEAKGIALERALILERSNSELRKYLQTLDAIVLKLRSETEISPLFFKPGDTQLTDAEGRVKTLAAEYLLLREAAEDYNALTYATTEAVKALAAAEKAGDTDAVKARTEEIKFLQEGIGLLTAKLDIQRFEIKANAEQAVISRARYSADLKVREIQKDIARGAISEFEGQRRIFSVYEEFRLKMRDGIEVLKDYVDAIKDLNPELAASIETFIDEVSTLGEVQNEVSAELSSSIQDGFTSLFETVINDARNAKQAVIDFGMSVLKTLNNLIAKKLADDLFNSLFAPSETGKESFLSKFARKLGLGGGLTASNEGARERKQPIVEPGDVAITARVGDTIGQGGRARTVGTATESFIKGLNKKQRATILGALGIEDDENADSILAAYLSRSGKGMAGAGGVLGNRAPGGLLGALTEADITKLASGAMKEAEKALSVAFDPIKTLLENSKFPELQQALTSIAARYEAIANASPGGKFIKPEDRITQNGDTQELPVTFKQFLSTFGITEDTLYKIGSGEIQQPQGGGAYNPAAVPKLFSTNTQVVGQVVTVTGGLGQQQTVAGSGFSGSPAPTQSGPQFSSSNGQLPNGQLSAGTTSEMNQLGITLGNALSTTKTEILSALTNISTAINTLNTTLTTTGITLKGAVDGVKADTTQSNDIQTQIETHTRDTATNTAGGGGGGGGGSTASSGQGSGGGGLFGRFSTQIFGGIMQLGTTALNRAIERRRNKTQAASGGYISGAGGPTSDLIPAWLSNGEFVIRAKAVDKLGLPFLQLLNYADKIKGFASGGRAARLTGIDDNANPMLAILMDEAAGGNGYARRILKQLGIQGFYRGGNPLITSSPYNTFNTGGKAATGAAAAAAAGPKSLSGFKKFANSKVGGALLGLGITIGFTLLSNWLFGQKDESKDEKRTPDPYGWNPETLTFYKRPIISGPRTDLADSKVYDAKTLKNAKKYTPFKGFAEGGLATLSNLSSSVMPSGKGIVATDILRDAMTQGAKTEAINIRQNINITTPDIHSFKSSRGVIERDMARMTQRGVRRPRRKY